MAWTKLSNKKSIISIVVVLGTFIHAQKTALAYDSQPWDYIAAPAGTTGLVLYSTYGNANRAITNGSRTDAQLHSFVNLVRAVHYFSVLGQMFDINISLPIGVLRDGRIGTTALGDASGIGDLALISSAWLVRVPERKFGVLTTFYLTIPTGNYKPGQPLNLGGNRMAYTIQVAATCGIGARWLVEGSADVTFYSDNRNVDGLGGRLSQDHTYTGQAWLSYQSTQASKLSVGYGVYAGGDQAVNGVANGFTSQKQQLRFAASYFLAPTVGVLGQVNHDFAVKGGFEQDISFLLRLLKLF